MIAAGFAPITCEHLESDLLVVLENTRPDILRNDFGGGVSSDKPSGRLRERTAFEVPGPSVEFTGVAEILLATRADDLR